MTRPRILQAALAFFGLMFCLTYVLALLWPSAWQWHSGPPNASPYFMTMVGIYAVLGVLLLRAAQQPADHVPLIRFAIWSSLVQGMIKLALAGSEAELRDHLFGDVAFLLLVAVVLGALTLERKQSASEA